MCCDSSNSFTISNLGLADPPDTVAITGSNGFEKTGDEVTLICTSSDGYPDPEVTISRGLGILETGPSPQSYTLTIAKTDNGATFTCNASNSVGTISTSLTFDVSCKIEHFNPLFDTLDVKLSIDPADSVNFSGTDGNAVENAPLTLVCTAVGGKPAPQLTISRNGGTLQTGPSPLSHTFSLTRAEEGAVFICSATNFVGTITTAQTFTVSSKLIILILRVIVS